MGVSQLNVVFDLGGVVFNWQPDALIASVFPDPAQQALVHEHVLNHPDWAELDRGTLDTTDAITRGALRCGLSEARVGRLLHGVPAALTPIEDTIALIQSLAGGHHPLYVLSNMHDAATAHLEATNDFWPVFEGCVFSCRVKLIKPEPGIYRHLLETYDLNPTETVFIDDKAINLDAASQFGIRTIQFADAGQCRTELNAMGVN